MNTTYIKNKPDSTWLSDTLEELPENCVFNKVTTGCGATHIALTNLIPTIVAVPFRVLIKDKQEDSQYNVLAVSSDYPCDVISKGTFKIICTYQALEKISKLVDISKYNLVIDEAHLLLQNASYSPKAIKWMMDNYTKFKAFTFMSATLHERDLWLPEMRELPLVEMVWDNIVPVKFIALNLKDTTLQDGLINITLNHLDGTAEGNPYFFYNSLKGIINLVRRLKKQKIVTNEDIRIVCSPTKYNTELLKHKLGIEIGKPSDKPSKINFITSTAFEGVNFYDKVGVSYIVSDRNSDFAKYDIVTTVPQIIGRIRDTKFKDTITIIYDSHSLKVSKNEAEVIEYSEYRLSEASKGVRDFNNTDAEDTKKGLLLWSLKSIYYYTDPEVLLDEDMTFDPVVNFNTTSLFINTYAPLIEMSFFKLINNVWHINISKDKEGNKTYKKDKEHFTLKYAIEENEKPLEGLSDKNKALLGKKISFKDLCLMYEEGEVASVELSDPMVVEYYKVLGEAKIQAYSYNSSKIKKLYDIESNSPENIALSLKRSFRVGKTYKKSYIKETLIRLNAIKKTATYLQNFFEVKTTTWSGESAYKIIKEL